MTCFEVLLAFPISSLYRQNLGNRLRLDHLRKHCSMDLISMYTKNGYTFYHCFICDTDAVRLLRDVPFPVFCVWIKFLRTNQFLYSCYKATHHYVLPPRFPTLLKDIYWYATKLEKGQFPLGMLKKPIES